MTETGRWGDIRIAKCPVCGVMVETDLGPGCSDHRKQVTKANKEKMAALRARRREDK